MAFEDLEVGRQRRLLRSLLDDLDPEIYPEFYVVSDATEKGSGWVIQSHGLDDSWKQLDAWDGKFTDVDIQDLTESEYLRMERAQRMEERLETGRRAYKCSLRPRATRERSPRPAPTAEPPPAAADAMQWGIPRIPPGAVIMVPGPGAAQEEPTQTSPLPQQGKVFAQHYEILEQLGHGGMGIVYKARDTRLDDVVALKTLRVDALQDPVRLKRFKQEIRLARKVTHPSVCRIHEYGEVDGVPYVSMELVEGEDLKKRLERLGPVPHEEALDLILQVLDGLEAIHQKGIIHRDLKSRNIMVDATASVRIMDFGIAKDDTPGSDHTSTGQLVGSVEYISPERLKDKPADARSDIYSVGIVCYELLKGQTPFHGKPEVVIGHHLSDPPDLSGIPVALQPLLQRALAKSPEDRYASAKEMAEALRSLRSPAPAARIEPVSVSFAGVTKTVLSAIAPPPLTKQQLSEALLLALYDLGAYGHNDVPIDAFTQDQAATLAVEETEIREGLRYLEAKGWFEYTTVQPTGQLTREGLAAAEAMRRAQPRY